MSGTLLSDIYTNYGGHILNYTICDTSESEVGQANAEQARIPDKRHKPELS